MDEKNVDTLDHEELEANTAEDEFTPSEEESGDESEVETGGDLSGDDEDGDYSGEEDESAEDSRRARKDRAKAQIERLKEENRRLKEENRKAKKENGLSPTSTDIMAKAFLAATHDIKESEAQEEALRLADKFEMTVDELMEDPDYRQRITGIQKRLVNQRKVAASSGGAAARKKGAEYAAEYFKKNHAFPEGTSLEVRSKALDLISGKNKQAWK